MGEEGSAKPVCAVEALDLLNCVTQSPYDQDKCLSLLHSLRDCVLAKRFYVIGEDGSSLAIASLLSLLNDGGNGNITFYMDEWDSCKHCQKVKKFSLAGQEQQETKPSGEKA